MKTLRIQQKENNIYVKTLDNIDSYLINIINRYFQDDANDIRLNVENIINETIRRIKEDIDVIIGDIILKNSVTSVNGKNGDVILKYTDLEAEKAFTKNTAFNKNFGNQVGTVCEGNDARLSNARTPLPHEHDNYITSLDLETIVLSTLLKNGLSISGPKIILSNKNLEIINGELEEK